MQANTRFLASLTAVLCAAAAACADANIPPNQDTNGADAAPVEVASAPETSSEDHVVEEVGLTTQAVVGGKESAPCGWPSTVDISGCTGTLIHPRVVTTAAHCLYGSSAMIKFTPGGKSPQGTFTVMGQCKSGARGSSGGSTGRDWGYCILPDDPRVKMMQITPPIVGCEADKYLKPGNTAWVVGFGTTGSGLNDNGIKREVEVKINKVQNGIVDIGDKEVGACHGDSGGPLYMKVTDGTHDWGWRVAGSTSGAGGNCDCACSTVYVDIRQHVKAIEENEDIDVTPCTDDEGNWAPGPDCKDFITDPGKGTGTYPMCTAPVTHEPIASCGAATGGAAGAAGGAAMAGAAGSGAGAAGAGAAAAAGSGALGRAGAGAAGAGAVAAGAAGRGAVAAAGGSAPTVGVGVTSQGAATAGAGAALAGRAAPSVGTAGASATAARAGSGAIGTTTSAALAAGSGATVTPAPEKDDGGCSVAQGRSSDARATWLLSLLAVVIARGFRRRQRQTA